jgi:hypothetical protein
VGGAVISISSVAVKAEDTDLASSAVLEIFEGSPSSDEKMLGAVLSVYAASDSGGGKVFLNWGSYWATFQCDRMFKSSFPFEVARDKDTRIAVSVCSAGSLGPKQARLVLTWSPCIPSGARLFKSKSLRCVNRKPFLFRIQYRICSIDFIKLFFFQGSICMSKAPLA